MYGVDYSKRAPSTVITWFIVLAISAITYDLTMIGWSGLIIAHTDLIWLYALCIGVIIICLWAILVHVMGIITVVEDHPSSNNIAFVKICYYVHMALIFVLMLFFGYMLAITQDDNKMLYAIAFGMAAIGLQNLLGEWVLYVYYIKPQPKFYYVLLPVASVPSKFSPY